MKITKTNAMRALDSAKLTYQVHEYPHGKEAVDGIHVAQAMGEDPCCVFKTLITQANTREYLVFMIPVGEELDLKLAAKHAGVKHTEMIPVKDITKVSGYVRGGCTAVGMKKQFPAFLDVSAQDKEKILVSGGRIGLQMELAPGDLLAACGGTYAELT